MEVEVVLYLERCIAEVGMADILYCKDETRQGWMPCGKSRGGLMHAYKLG
jgi:hypothetical protein